MHLNQLAPLLSQMDQRRIEKAVVFWGHNSDNVEVVRAAALHPERLVPFLSVSPERDSPYGDWWRAGDRRLLEYAARELGRGVYRGLGELSIVHFPSRGFPETEFSPLHPLMTGLMDLAREHDLPVMVHCEMTYARELDQLLVRYPSVRFIWAHGGYAPLYWTERMLERHPNLTIDLSMRTVRDHPRSPDYWILKDERRVWPRWLQLIEDNPGRFVVGTDSAQRSVDTDVDRISSVGLLLSQLSPEARRKVSRENMEALLVASREAPPRALRKRRLKTPRATR